jgi:hypothetical protein
MTQTREVPQDVYRDITDQAHAMHARFSDLMDGLSRGPGGVLTDEWHELHELMQLSGVIAAQAGRYAEQAPDPDAPVPYAVAKGLRDLDAAVKAENPGHAIYVLAAFDEDEVRW